MSGANGRLGETEYAEIVGRVRESVASAIPPGASVLVVSKGDSALLEQAGHAMAHFPQDAAGQYAGHHPHDSAGATAELERLRRHGAEYFVVPETARWWLDFYDEFATHLATHCQLVDDVPGACLIYGLGGATEASAPAPATASPQGSVEQLRDFLQRLLSPDSPLIVLDAGEGIAASLAPLRAQPLAVSAEGTDAARLLERLRDHAISGAEYLVVPRRGGEWLKRNPEAADELETACRTVADQRHLCRIFDLTALREER
jgi:hypothetical protein